jgi:hypothetical protein
MTVAQSFIDFAEGQARDLSSLVGDEGLQYAIGFASVEGAKNNAPENGELPINVAGSKVEFFFNIPIQEYGLPSAVVIKQLGSTAVNANPYSLGGHLVQAYIPIDKANPPPLLKESYDSKTSKEVDEVVIVAYSKAPDAEKKANIFAAAIYKEQGEDKPLLSVEGSGSHYKVTVSDAGMIESIGCQSITGTKQVGPDSVETALKQAGMGTNTTFTISSGK